MSFDLCCNQLFKNLSQLSKIDMNKLSLQVQTKQRKEVSLLYSYQLVISLKYSRNHYNYMTSHLSLLTLPL